MEEDRQANNPMGGDPVFLYHYFDQTIGPFVNLSDLPISKAEEALLAIKENKPTTLSAKRQPDYMQKRHAFEQILRTEFAKKGGVITRSAPHYMVVEHSPWLSTWFENSTFIKIPIEAFDIKTISFTYGDSHPVFSPLSNKMDGKEYRKRLYTYSEITQLIERYGLPQDWNNDGTHGPERYIEAHIWSDATIEKYR